MSHLLHDVCVPCEKGALPLSANQIEPLLLEVKNWHVIDAIKIERLFLFDNFCAALVFINRVGAVAEEQGHHPDIFLHAWNHVTITLWTHAIYGLSKNDFILAAKIDEAFEK